MTPDPLLDRMAFFPDAVSALLRGVTDEDARWRPTADAWSIVEIVRHLLDEEIEDFRARILSTLDDAERPWTPIDPPGWVRDRRYIEADLGDTLAAFTRERAESLRILEWRKVDQKSWGNTYEHPALGALRAGDLLVSWATHDALHLRQLARRLYELVSRDGAPFNSDYAGPY